MDRFFHYFDTTMEIVKYPAEVLRGRAEKLNDINGDLAQFTQEMVKTMILGRGVGLAAPQVGQLWSLFVAQVEEGKPLVFINPEIIGTSLETEPYEEGCLSLPGLYAEVIRPSSVQIQAWNEKGKFFKMEATGLLARVIQHEMDHLKGTLFVDHLSAFKQERLLKFYEKQAKA